MGPDVDAGSFARAVREVLDRHLVGGGSDPGPASGGVGAGRAGGRVPGVWAALVELGVPALLVPEAAGGFGADETALLPVLLELGRAAVAEPVLEGAVAAAVLGRCADERAAGWLDALAAGRLVAGVGLQPGGLASVPADAGLVLVAAGGPAAASVGRQEALCALVGTPPGGSAAVEQPAADPGTRLVRLPHPAGDEAPVDGADVGYARDLAAWAAAAQLVGLGRALLQTSVRYAGTRTQFGRPIGSFQAVKHRLADVHVALVFAAPLLERAAWSLARALPTAGRDAAHAKWAANHAAGDAARAALQVHGAIGYTFEHDLHVWLNRVWTLRSMWGDEDRLADRLVATLFDGGPAGARLPDGPPAFVRTSGERI